MKNKGLFNYKERGKLKLNRVKNYLKLRVAKYIRLSREDGDDRESESVENQRDIIDNCYVPYIVCR